jgi:hypothetical protein
MVAAARGVSFVAAACCLAGAAFYGCAAGSDGGSGTGSLAPDSASPDEAEGGPDASFSDSSFLDTGPTGDTGTLVGSGDSSPTLDSGPNDSSSEAAAAFTVGGNLSGLHAGDSVTLQNNGGSPLTLSTNGAFAFPSLFASGQTYDVTVLTQPAAPAETCRVVSGMGTIQQSSVTTLSVTCSPDFFSVGGTVSGLAAGATVELSLNGGSPLGVQSSGAFTFPITVESGDPYDVTVTSNPASQTCTVAGGSGTVGSSNVTSVLVTCACAPTTCAAQGANCGSIADGCGATVACGTCGTNQGCGVGGTPNVCAACGVAEGNTTFAAGTTFPSCDGRFDLVMQATDGNLVLYMGSVALWDAQTAGHPGARAVMQGDGNFVVYSAANVALWSSATAGNPGAYLAVQNDGNLVVYSASAAPLWSSGTGGH